MFNAKFFTIAGAALATFTLAACSYGTNASNAPQNQAAAQAVSVANADTVASGTFVGRSDHVTTGGVSLVQTASGYQLVFAGDFSLDGAPDPKVGFGNGGAYDTASQVSPLLKKTGAQTYSLPAGFNPSSYSEVYIWCEQFAVPLGVAELK